MEGIVASARAITTESDHHQSFYISVLMRIIRLGHPPSFDILTTNLKWSLVPQKLFNAELDDLSKNIPVEGNVSEMRINP